MSTAQRTTAPAPTTTAPAPAPSNAASPAGVITGLALALGLLGTIGLVGRFFPFF